MHSTVHSVQLKHIYQRLYHLHQRQVFHSCKSLCYRLISKQFAFPFTIILSSIRHQSKIPCINHSVQTHLSMQCHQIGSIQLLIRLHQIFQHSHYKPHRHIICHTQCLRRIEWYPLASQSLCHHLSLFILTHQNCHFAKCPQLSHLLYHTIHALLSPLQLFILFIIFKIFHPHIPLWCIFLAYSLLALGIYPLQIICFYHFLQLQLLIYQFWHFGIQLIIKLNHLTSTTIILP